MLRKCSFITFFAALCSCDEVISSSQIICFNGASVDDSFLITDALANRTRVVHTIVTEVVDVVVLMFYDHNLFQLMPWCFEFELLILLLPSIFFIMMVIIIIVIVFCLWMVLVDRVVYGRVEGALEVVDDVVKEL